MRALSLIITKLSFFVLIAINYLVNFASMIGNYDIDIHHH